MEYVKKGLALILVLAAVWSIPFSADARHRRRSREKYRVEQQREQQAEQAAPSTYADYAEQVLRLVNQERQRYSLPPLTLSRELMEAAAIRAEEITRVFDHTRPNGEPCYSMFENGAYTVGENIAAGSPTPVETMQQWMESPGHRENILDADYTELGVGFVQSEASEYQYYWVQLFRRPMSRAMESW